MPPTATPVAVAAKVAMSRFSKIRNVADGACNLEGTNRPPARCGDMSPPVVNRRGAFPAWERSSSLRPLMTCRVCRGRPEFYPACGPVGSSRGRQLAAPPSLGRATRKATTGITDSLNRRCNQGSSRSGSIRASSWVRARRESSGPLHTPKRGSQGRRLKPAPSRLHHRSGRHVLS